MQINSNVYEVQKEWSNLDQGCVMSMPPGPRLWGVSASQARPGDRVTITGARLDLVTTVAVGLVAMPFSRKKGTLVAIVPNDARSGRVSINDGTNIAVGPMLQVDPLISRLSSKGGAPGIAVTIDGAGFAGADT